MSFLATDAAWWLALGLWGGCALLLLLIGWQEARHFRRDAAERARLRRESARVQRVMKGEW